MPRLTVVKVKIGVVRVNQNTEYNRYFVTIIFVGHNMVFIELSIISLIHLLRLSSYFVALSVFYDFYIELSVNHLKIKY